MNIFTPTELAAMHGDEFSDAIEGKIFDMTEFEDFLDPSVIDRTIDYLTTFAESLEGQLAKFGEGPTARPDWVRKTTSLRGVVRGRLKMADRRKRNSERRERREQGSETITISELKRFAHRLAEALDKYEGANLELDIIDFPFGEMTAREWLRRRLEKDPERTGDNA